MAGHRRGRSRHRSGVGVVAVACAILTTGLATAGCAAFGSAATSPTTPSPVRTHRTGSPQNSPSPDARASTPAKQILAGKVVGIDPGHNGLNYTNPAFLAKQIWNGREWENCDTTGTQTASGYPESQFTFNVATYLAADLRALGAKVVLTRHNNHGLGPCVNTRSYIIDRAHANVAIDIHADGGPAWGRGFTVLEPVPDSTNASVVPASLLFGAYVHQAFLADTPMPVSDYYGTDGYIQRNDLAGLNLTTVPKVLIECGNMPNATDAALLTSPAVQRQIARALLYAIVRFLTGHWPAGTGG